MSGAKEKVEKKKRSTVSISSDSSPPSKEKHKRYQVFNTNDVSPPAPVSTLTNSKASLQANDSSAPAPKAEPPKMSPPEEKKSPPPAPNPPPKQTPKISPPPSPPSPSGSPPSPPKQQLPPQQTPTTPTKQWPPQQEQPTTTTATKQSPSQQSPSTTTQQSSPSSTPNKKQSPPSPSNPTKKPSQSSQQNSPSDSKPAESSSDNSLSPPSPSTDASQSPPSADSASAPTSTPTSVPTSTGTMTPGFPPQTSVNMPQPIPPVSPSNAVGGSYENNNSRSSNSALNITYSEHPSYGFVIGTAVVAVLIIALVLFLFFRDRRKQRQQNSIAKFMATPADISVISGAIKGHSPQNGQQLDMENSSDNQNSGDIYVSKTSFTYEEVMEMTDGFARENMIGEGGFGCVYKGRMSDGKIVAVKRLKIGSGQGEREFRAEVEIISRVHHRHLVSLVGYCIAKDQRLLIYEFVPNSTLERHLHGKDLPVLEWAKRVKIAEGAAKGLAYLHEDCHPKIIHRDIKSANILLDEEFEAQVADFGLARLNDTCHSHVSTRVMGTFGYLAPEYASSGKLTDKSDVYSFGVVILELITGRKPVDPTRPLGDESLVEYARPLLIEALKTGDFGELIDPRLEKRYVESEVFRMVEAAAACVRHSVTKRPRMALVARALDFEGDPDLSNGVKVGQSTAYDSAQYSEEITRFRRMEFGCDNSSESDTYSDESISREVSGGLPNSGMSWYSSGESTTGSPELKALNRHRVADNGGSRNYGGGPFR